MRTVKSDSAGLDEAVRILLSGGVVIIPTDTVYGLAAHPGFPEAVERLYTIKGRDFRKPIAVLASGRDAVESFLGAELPGRAASLAGEFWPGALTMVLPGAGGATEGVRVPAHGWTRRLIDACGGVLRVTSANLSGCMPATDAAGALASIGLDADLLVDDGVSPGGVASTVVAIGADGSERLLRAGAVKL